MDTKKKKSKFKEMMGPPFIKTVGPPKSLMRKKRKAKKKINKNLIPSEPRNMPGVVPQG
mgnify:CR=1 FL=1